MLDRHEGPVPGELRWIGRTSGYCLDSARAKVLRGLRAERYDLAEDAEQLDAFITGDGFDKLGRANKILLLRRHAALIWRIETLDARIAAFGVAEEVVA
jgi:hypothetical protein